MESPASSISNVTDKPQTTLTSFQIKKAKYFFHINLDLENKRYITWTDVEFYILFHVTVAQRENDADLEKLLFQKTRVVWEEIQKSHPTNNKDHLSLNQFMDTWADLIEYITTNDKLPEWLNEWITAGFQLYNIRAIGKLRPSAFHALYNKMGLDIMSSATAFHALTEASQTALTLETITELTKKMIISNDPKDASRFLLPGFDVKLSINGHEDSIRDNNFSNVNSVNSDDTSITTSTASKTPKHKKYISRSKTTDIPTSKTFIQNTSTKQTSSKHIERPIHVNYTSPMLESNNKSNPMHPQYFQPNSNYVKHPELRNSRPIHEISDSMNCERGDQGMICQILNDMNINPSECEIMVDTQNHEVIPNLGTSHEFNNSYEARHYMHPSNIRQPNHVGNLHDYPVLPPKNVRHNPGFQCRQNPMTLQDRPPISNLKMQNRNLTRQPDHNRGGIRNSTMPPSFNNAFRHLSSSQNSINNMYQRRNPIYEERKPPRVQQSHAFHKPINQSNIPVYHSHNPKTESRIPTNQSHFQTNMPVQNRTHSNIIKEVIHRVTPIIREIVHNEIEKSRFPLNSKLTNSNHVSYSRITKDPNRYPNSQKAFHANNSFSYLPAGSDNIQKPDGNKAYNQIHQFPNTSLNVNQNLKHRNKEHVYSKSLPNPKKNQTTKLHEKQGQDHEEFWRGPSGQSPSINKMIFDQLLRKQNKVTFQSNHTDDDKESESENDETVKEESSKGENIQSKSRTTSDDISEDMIDDEMFFIPGADGSFGTFLPINMQPNFLQHDQFQGFQFTPPQFMMMNPSKSGVNDMYVLVNDETDEYKDSKISDQENYNVNDEH